MIVEFLSNSQQKQMAGSKISLFYAFNVSLLYVLVNCQRTEAQASTTTKPTYKGYRVGDFEGNAYGLRGTVYIADCVTIIIENFKIMKSPYELLPKTYFLSRYRDLPESEKGDDAGSLLFHKYSDMDDLLANYNNSDITLGLSDDHSAWSLVSIYVYSRLKKVSFGGINFPKVHQGLLENLNVPRVRKIGHFSGGLHGVSGHVTILNSHTLSFDNFNYDGSGEDVYIYAGRRTDATDTMWKLENPSFNINGSGMGIVEHADFCVTLPHGVSIITDVDYISVHSQSQEVDYGSVSIPANIRTMEWLVPYAEYRQGSCSDYCASSQSAQENTAYQYAGSKVGEFSGTMYNLSGMVYTASCSVMIISEFTLINPPLYTGFWINEKGGSPKQDGSGYRIPYETDFLQGLETHNNTDIILALPEWRSVGDVHILYLWNYVENRSLGALEFPDNMEIAAHVYIDEITTVSNNVSGTVIALTEKTLFVKDFHYDGASADAYFYVGSGYTPSSSGFKIIKRHYQPYVHDMDDNYDNGYYYYRFDQAQDRYDDPLQHHQEGAGRGMCLTLPDNMTLFDINYLSIFSASEDKSFGHVVFNGSALMGLVSPYLHGSGGCIVENSRCTDAYFTYNQFIYENPPAYETSEIPFIFTVGENMAQTTTEYYDPQYNGFEPVHGNARSQHNLPQATIILLTLLLPFIVEKPLTFLSI